MGGGHRSFLGTTQWLLCHCKKQGHRDFPKVVESWGASRKHILIISSSVFPLPRLKLKVLPSLWSDSLWQDTLRTKNLSPQVKRFNLLFPDWTISCLFPLHDRLAVWGLTSTFWCNVKCIFSAWKVRNVQGFTFSSEQPCHCTGNIISLWQTGFV